jgi:hypothetical protein
MNNRQKPIRFGVNFLPIKRSNCQTSSARQFWMSLHFKEKARFSEPGHMG